MEIDFALPAWLLWTLAAVVGVPLYAVVGAATAGLAHRLEGGGEIDDLHVLTGLWWPFFLPILIVAILVVGVAFAIFPFLRRIALFVATAGSQKKG